MRGFGCTGQHRPDVIITDVMVPGEDGIQLVRQLKKEFPDIKVICISGGLNGDVSWIQSMADIYGAFAFLKKPFGFRDLKGVIDLVLAADASGGESPLTH